LAAYTSRRITTVLHDREDPGAAVIILLQFDVIVEQAPYFFRIFVKRRRRAGRHQRIELAVSDHLRQRLGWPDGMKANGRRKIELDFLVAPGLFLAAGEMLDVRDPHAVVVGQDAADPHRRRHLVLRHADALALQVLGAADAALCRDED